MSAPVDVLKILSSTRSIISGLPEVPGYNGSILMMDDTERDRIESELDRCYSAVEQLISDFESKKIVGLCQSFEESSQPLIKWMSENSHPHHTVIVNSTGAELLEGQRTAQLSESQQAQEAQTRG